MRRNLISIVVVLLLLGAMPGAHRAEASVSEITLGRLGGIADADLIGRVARTIEVPVESLPDAHLAPTKATLAEVVVSEWLKGDPRPKSIWVWASGTWVCDVTRAIEGERALFFLEAQGVGDLVTPESVRRLSEAVLGAVIHRVEWSGRGQMPFHTIAGRDYAKVWADDVRLPGEMDTIPGPDPRYTAFQRDVLVDDLRAYLRVRFARPPDRSERRSDPVPDLLRALDGPYEVSEEAAHALRQLGEKVIPVLRRISRDASSPLRDSAAVFLGCAVEKGAEAVLEDLRSDDILARRGAAYAIEMITRADFIHGDGAERAFYLALDDPDPEVRWRVLRGLVGRYEPFEGDLAKAVLRALKDDSEVVRWHAARHVRRLLYYSSSDADDRDKKATVETHLLALLGSGKLRLQRALWEALAVSAGDASMEPVKLALANPDPVVRVNAAGALALMDSTESFQMLVSLLEDADPWMRRKAAHGLGLSAAKAGVEPLMKALQDPDERTRWIVAWALGEIGSGAAKAVPALKALLKTEGESRLRFEVEDALDSILTDSTEK